MPWLEAPTSFRLRSLPDTVLNHNQRRTTDDQLPMLMATIAANATMSLLDKIPLPPHSNHPDFLHLAGLVCEAVLEVVFVALPGFIVAYTGMFDANSQKLVAELNTMVFTPCLIFSKLASQLKSGQISRSGRDTLHLRGADTGQLGGGHGDGEGVWLRAEEEAEELHLSHGRVWE